MKDRRVLIRHLFFDPNGVLECSVCEDWFVEGMEYIHLDTDKGPIGLCYKCAVQAYKLTH